MAETDPELGTSVIVPSRHARMLLSGIHSLDSRQKRAGMTTG